MKILVLNGSPRKNGNTARLVQAFERGAKEAGHSVKIENVALKKINGCKACEYCHEKEKAVCVQKDDMQDIYPKIKEADMLVMASPIYYYTMTGQIISALNRTYALGRLAHIKKTALILSSGAPDMYEAAVTQYKGVTGWGGAVDDGIFAVPGMVRSHSPENTGEEWLERLYQFGRNLK